MVKKMNDKNGMNDALNNLSEERLKIISEAAVACNGKTGMERFDVFLEYGEKLSEGEPMSKSEQKALLAAIAASLSDGERKQLEQLMGMMGM